MRRPIVSLVRLSLVVAIGLLAHSAAAAPYLEVKYDVISGSFSGPHLSGAITGGTVTFTMPNVTTTRFFSCYYGYGCGYVSTLHLTGSTGGSFTLISPATISNAYGSIYYYPYPTGTPTTTYTYPYAYARANGAGIIYAYSGGYTVAYGGVGVIRIKYPTMASYSPTSFNLGVAQLPGKFFHNAILGNEVRTVIPEPSTGALLALGLGFMGVAGGSGGLVARMRRARRR